MLSPTAALWVSAYLVLIHLLCAILTRIFRSNHTRTRINGCDFDHPRTRDADHNPSEQCLERVFQENHCFSSSSAIPSKYQSPGANSCSGHIEEPRSENIVIHHLFTDSGGKSILTERPSNHEGEKREVSDPRPGSIYDNTYFEVELPNGHHKLVAREKVPSSSNRAIDATLKTQELHGNQQSKNREVKDSENMSDHVLIPRSNSADDELMTIRFNNPTDLHPTVVRSRSDHPLDENHHSSEDSNMSREPIQWSSYKFSFSNYHNLGCSGLKPWLEFVAVDAVTEGVDLREENDSATTKAAASDAHACGLVPQPQPRENQKETRSYDEDDGHFTWAPSTQSINLEEEDPGSDSNELDDNDDDDYLKNPYIQYMKTTTETTTSENHYNEEYPQVQEEEEDGRPYDDTNDVDEDFDVLLEHQELVQKLKKELKHSQTLGLPTILEEVESLKLDEHLKPLKIDEKNKYKDQMEEIKRFYMSYSAKMRKLDILCRQTMYATVLRQMKNQNQILTTNKNTSIPSFISSTNLRKDLDDLHGKKLFDSLNRDLELIYVAQVCLSWEILKWQHCKAEELQLYHPSMTQQYTLVAKEFQRFQVLTERFTEDEVFLGPRIQNYVNNRCVNQNFHQVPMVKDDGKSQEWEEGDDMIVITKLTKIVEASMHAFCDFVLADKKEERGGLRLKSWQGNKTCLDDPSNAELLTRLRTDLQKKERRLKDLVNSGNCLVKKFQKQQDLKWSYGILVAQVELRLVSRTLGMSRLTTDQLLWCHKKLSNINFTERKIHGEPSFLLFPC